MSERRAELDVKLTHVGYGKAALEKAAGRAEQQKRFQAMSLSERLLATLRLMQPLSVRGRGR